MVMILSERRLANVALLFVVETVQSSARFPKLTPLLDPRLPKTLQASQILLEEGYEQSRQDEVALDVVKHGD